jgi:hypothetical protein
MGRPRKNATQAAAAIEAEISEETAQQALLKKDLREALIAGENSRPYRAALDEIAEKIAQLQSKLAVLQEAEAERRRALTAATAVEIAAESSRRHIDFLSRLDIPALPKLERFSNVAP